MVSLGDKVFYFRSLADFVGDVEALMEWTSHGPLHITKGPTNCCALQRDYDPYRIQTAPGFHKTDELSCFSARLRRSRHFFLFSPIKTWTAVREPGVCESGVREVPVEWKTSLFEP
ncbi:hypothetical protein TNCV_2187301 [Trichonephila clavipes]|nr:hypothetical protein TNCV_2187301 [Trichonephila clavipes]